MSEQPDDLSGRIRAALDHEVRATPRPPVSWRRDSRSATPSGWQSRRVAIAGAGALLVAATIAVAVIVARDNAPDTINVGGSPTDTSESQTETSASPPDTSNNGVDPSAVPPPTTVGSTEQSGGSTPPPTPSPTTPSTPSTSAAPRWARLPGGVRVAVAAADGVYIVTDAGASKVTNDRYTDVVGDPSTLALFGQLWVDEPLVEGAGPDRAGPIGRISNDGTWEPLVSPPADSAGLRLHDAAVVEDRSLLFYEIIRNPIALDDPTRNALIELDLLSGDSRQIAELGGWEDGTSRLRWSQAARRLIGERFSGPCSEPISIALDNSEPQLGPYSACDDSSKPAGFTPLDDGRLAWTRTAADPSTGVATFTIAEVGEVAPEPAAELSWAYPADGYWAPASGTIEAGHSLAVVNPYRYEWESAAPLQRATMLDLRTGGVFHLPVAGRAVVVAEPGPVAETGWIFPGVTVPGASLDMEAGSPQEISDRWVAAVRASATNCDGLDVWPSLVSDTLIEIEVRESCDDSVAGTLHRLTLVPSAGGFVADSLTLTTMCWRGVTQVVPDPTIVCV